MNYNTKLIELEEWLRDKTWGFEQNSFSGIEVTEILTKIKHLKEDKSGDDDICFIRELLPDTYTITESDYKGSIKCESDLGIFRMVSVSDGYDGILYKYDDDEDRWEDIKTKIKEYFGNRFEEIFHHVSLNHRKFTIYLKQDPFFRPIESK